MGIDDLGERRDVVDKVDDLRREGGVTALDKIARRRIARGRQKNCARRPTSWFWPSPIWSRPTGRLCARGIDLRASESRRLTPPPPRARRSGGGGDAESDDECDGEGDGSSRSTSKRTKARTPGSAARMSARWATTTPLTERIRSPSRSEPCCCVEKGDDGDAARGGAASSCVTVPSSVRSKPTRSPAARTNQVASAERGPTERARFSCDSCLLKMEGAIRHGGTIASSESARSFHETLRLARRIGMSPELAEPGEPWSSKSLKVSGGPDIWQHAELRLGPPQNPLSISFAGKAAPPHESVYHEPPRRRRIAERRAASMLATALLAPGVTLTTSTTVPGVDRLAVHRFVATPDNWPSIVLSSQSVAGDATSRPIQPGESVDEIFGAPPILPLRVTWTCVATDEAGGTLDLVSDAGLGGVARDCRMKFAVADASDGVRIELQMSYTPTSILATLAQPILRLDNEIALRVLLRRALLNTS